MAGAFDGLMSDSGVSGGPGDLDPELLNQILALRQSGYGTRNAPDAVTPGSVYNSLSGAEGTPLNDYSLVSFAGSRDQGTGASIEQLYDPSRNVDRIYGKTRGGSWSNQSTPVYDTNGRFLGYDSGDGDNLSAAKFAALSAGAYYGAGALNGAVGAGTAGAGAAAGAGTSAAEQIAFLSANGMSDAAIAQAYPALAQAGGLTGVGGGAAAAGAANWGDSIKTGLQTAGDGLKSAGINGGDLLKTGTQLAVASALSKNVSNPTADPNLTTAITGLDKTANDASARAQANDEYWRTTFAPRYLRAMDDQLALGKQQSDFNMGLAKKYDARYWQQMGDLDSRVNAYDSDAARARFAGEAGANSDMQSAAAMQALVRDMNRRGMNPNSGAVVSNMRQQAQQGALQKTLAMNMAREAARKEGFNMRLVTAGLGNPTGASTGFSSLANQSAGIGMNGIQGANSGFNSNVGNWNATTGVGIGAMNSVGNWGMGLTNGNLRANEMNTQGWNQMLGYGLGMFGSGRGG